MVGALTSILIRQRGRQLYRQVAQKPARDSLQGLNWREFEILMLEWFAQQGYQLQDNQLGADRGVDIVLRIPRPVQALAGLQGRCRYRPGTARRHGQRRRCRRICRDLWHLHG